MVVRAVEGQKLWTGWTAITVDQLNKTISLNLRDENNLIEYDVGDDEIYVDLQLGDEIRPTSDFPVWVTVWRAITDNGWWMTGTILVAKTTSGDNIKLFYCDDWKLYIDNGTWTFKQIYLKSEVDALLALKQDLLTAGDNIIIDENNVISATSAPHWIASINWDAANNVWVLNEGELVEDTVCIFINPTQTQVSVADYIEDGQWVGILRISDTIPTHFYVPAYGVLTWLLKSVTTTIDDEPETSWYIFPRETWEMAK